MHRTPLSRRLASAATMLAAVTAAGGIGLAVATPSAAAPCTGYVALTFDDGPNANTTPTLLDTLKAAGARATLFNVGQYAQANPDLVRAEAAAGMWVENHSWSHPYLTQLGQDQMRSEISQTQQIIEQLTGRTPTLFRPPYFDTNDTLRAVEGSFGLIEITADVDTRDWDNVSADQIVLAADALDAGEIIIMHDWPPNTIQAIPRIVANLGARGLCPGMISPVTGRAVAPDDDPQTTPTTTTTTRSTTTTTSTTTSTTTTSTTTTSTTTTSTTPPTTTQGPGGCTATYTVQSQWPGGFVATVEVAAGATAIEGWTVTVALPSGTSINNLWSGQPSGTSGTVRVTNAAYNGRVTPGQKASFGFVGNGIGAGATVSCVAA